MTKSFQFLAPRLVGKRFQGHTIPLEILKDLAVLQEMVVEVAQWHYLKDHPDWKQPNRGFLRTFSLHLDGIGEGTAFDKLELIITLSGGVFPSSAQECFERARDSIVSAIIAAERGASITLPRQFLSYFDRMGLGLLEGESIEFAPDKPQKASLTRETRRKLVMASDAEHVSEEITLRGSIPEMDQETLTFRLMLADGKRVAAPIPAQFRETILDAFNGYKDGKRVLLKGIGTFSRSGKLMKIDEIEHIGPLDPNDVESRIDELRSLQDGWLEGAGTSPPKSGLDWFVHTFNRWYPDDLPLPFLYPTPEGGLQAEWSFDRTACSLEIDLVTHRGSWHSIELASRQDEEREFDLEAAEGWSELVTVLRQFGGAA